MTNLPSATDLFEVNGLMYSLQVGSNPDTYILLQDMISNIERDEDRETVSTTPAVYFFGPGDNWIEATLLLSLTEFQTFNTNSQLDSNGNLPFQYYKVKMTDKSGNVKTIGNTNNSPTGFKARVVRVQSSKPVRGGVKARIRLRITDDLVTVT